MPDAGTSFQVIFTSGGAVGIATANYNPTTGPFQGLLAQEAYISLESNDIRFHFSGLTPAAACGHIFVADAAITLSGIHDISNFKGITTAGGVTATACVTLRF